MKIIDLIIILLLYLFQHDIATDSQTIGQGSETIVFHPFAFLADSQLVVSVDNS